MCQVAFGIYLILIWRNHVAHSSYSRSTDSRLYLTRLSTSILSIPDHFSLSFLGLGVIDESLPVHSSQNQCQGWGNKIR